jgi:hypothetical protein
MVIVIQPNLMTYAKMGLQFGETLREKAARAGAIPRQWVTCAG